MKDVMIDLETFGNGPNKVICQIGAVYFDRTTGELGQTFEVNVDARSSQAFGGVIDADTVYWWLQQSDEARKSLLENKISLREALESLNLFLVNADRIWSHATFDFVTIMDAFRAVSLKPCFSHKAGMDLRTLTYLAKISPQDFTRDGTHHNGLADAIFQVKYCVAALNKIQGDRGLVTRLKQLIG